MLFLYMLLILLSLIIYFIKQLLVLMKFFNNQNLIYKIE